MNYGSETIPANCMMTPTTGYSNPTPVQSYSNPSPAPNYSNPMNYYPFLNQTPTSGYGSFGLSPSTDGGYTVGQWNQTMGSSMYYGSMCSQIMNQNQPISNAEPTNQSQEVAGQGGVAQCPTMNFNAPYNTGMFAQDIRSKDWSQMTSQFSSPSTSTASLGGQSSFPTPDVSFSSDSSSPAGVGFCTSAPFMRPPAHLNVSLEDSHDHGHIKFTEVSGKLLLLTDSTKYPVTVGEMVRRSSAPESLHASLLNGMLRKAKGRENADKLRKDLRDVNIDLPVGRRKQVAATTFTSLVEAETLKMAKDWQELLTKEGGCHEIAREIVAGVDVQVLQQQVAVARVVFDILLRLFQSIPQNPGDIKPRTAYEEAINKFSRLTHGFGHLALRFFLEYLDEIFNKIMEESANPSSFMGAFSNVCSSQDPFMQTPSCSMPQQFQTAPPPMFLSQGHTSNLQYAGQPADLSQVSTSYSPFPSGLGAESSDVIQQTVMEQVFDEIVGRLCLLGNNQRYKITVGEMARRIASPETLHVSLLNGLLRKGKNTQCGGRTLQKRLEENGIQLKAKRRKSVPNTVFTALCEGEAIRLAKDFGELLSRFGGADVIYEQIRLMEYSGSRDQFEKSMVALRYLVILVRNCFERVPENPAEQNKYTGTESQRAITKFSLLTHGFGNVAAWSILSFTEKICIGTEAAAIHPYNHGSGEQFSGFK